jgi:hypothetical protein
MLSDKLLRAASLQFANHGTHEKASFSKKKLHLHLARMTAFSWWKKSFPWRKRSLPGGENSFLQKKKVVTRIKNFFPFRKQNIVVQFNIILPEKILMQDGNNIFL